MKGCGLISLFAFFSAFSLAGPAFSESCPSNHNYTLNHMRIHGNHYKSDAKIYSSRAERLWKQCEGCTNGDILPLRLKKDPPDLKFPPKISQGSKKKDRAYQFFNRWNSKLSKWTVLRKKKDYIMTKKHKDSDIRTKIDLASAMDLSEAYSRAADQIKDSLKPCRKSPKRRPSDDPSSP